MSYWIFHKGNKRYCLDLRIIVVRKRFYEMSSPEKFEIEVGGEIGKNNTLPVDYLVELAKKLQALILEIASYDLPTDQSIVLENFKLELKTFKKGSAIPGFIFTPRVQEVVVSDVAR